MLSSARKVYKLVPLIAAIWNKYKVYLLPERAVTSQSASPSQAGVMSQDESRSNIAC